MQNEDSPKAMRLSRDGFFVPRNLSVGTVLDTDPSNAVLNSIVRSMDYIGIRHEVATLVYPDGQVRLDTK